MRPMVNCALPSFTRQPKKFRFVWSLKSNFKLFGYSKYMLLHIFLTVFLTNKTNFETNILQILKDDNFLVKFKFQSLL